MCIRRRDAISLHLGKIIWLLCVGSNSPGARKQGEQRLKPEPSLTGGQSSYSPPWRLQVNLRVVPWDSSMARLVALNKLCVLCDYGHFIIGQGRPVTGAGRHSKLSLG